VQNALASVLQAVDLSLKAPGDLKLDTPIVPLIAPDFAVPPSEWQRTPPLDNALSTLNKAFDAVSQIPGDLQGARIPLAESISAAAKNVLAEIYALKAVREGTGGSAAISSAAPH
jgi:hypothetical protein